MPRKRRQTDWEGIIRAGAALFFLFAIFGGLTGGLSFFQSGASVLFFLALITLAVVAFILVTVMVVRGVAGTNLFTGKEKNAASLSAQTGPSYAPEEGPPNVENALSALDWFQLEQLVARLFEVKGCSVIQRGGAKADGGIDLVVQTEFAHAAVQCKHWSKWKCGPAVVRELIGSMVHENTPQGFLVCRSATDEAKVLAASHRIRIIEREGLIERIEAAIAEPESLVATALFSPPKLCPKCGANMVLRTASKGRNPGSEFWGCSTYPNCRQILKI